MAALKGNVVVILYDESKVLEEAYYQTKSFIDSIVEEVETQMATKKTRAKAPKAAEVKIKIRGSAEKVASALNKIANRNNTNGR